MTRILVKHHAKDPASCHDKLVALRQASLASGAFIAAEPIRFLSGSGDSEMVWVDGVSPLAEILPRLSPAMSLDAVDRVGQALAALHANWHLPNACAVSIQSLLLPAGAEMAGRLRPAVLDAGAPVLCHGDFGLGNVLWNASLSTLPVIVDPEPAPFLTCPAAAMCSPYLDVAHFISCLEGVFPIYLYPRYSWTFVPLLRERFVEAYERASGRRLDRMQVKAVAACLLSQCSQWMVKRRGWFRAGVYRIWLMKRARRLAEDRGEA